MMSFVNSALFETTPLQHFQEEFVKTQIGFEQSRS